MYDLVKANENKHTTFKVKSQLIDAFLKVKKFSTKHWEWQPKQILIDYNMY